MNKNPKKCRLDVAMVEQGLAPSREKAKALIMCGLVSVGGEKHEKAGDMVKPDVEITVKESGQQYVSRGGKKLEKAMQEYPISLDGKICMDIGASTGGFTDCMLQNGAVRVYSVDVGYGQLAWKLRTDERVVNLERTNVRYLTEEQVPDKIQFASVDVSFISLTLVLPVLYGFLAEGGEAVCLVKPQFEAGKGKVGKKGVVRDPAVHQEVCEKIYDFCTGQGFGLKGMTFSPIKGPEGNIEYLFYLSKDEGGTAVGRGEIAALVTASHEQL